MLYLVMLQSDPDRRIFILTNLLLFAAAFLIAWAPSILVRKYIFKEPVPWWAGVLVAAVTFFFGMIAGALLLGDRPGINQFGAVAAVCAYFTVTRRGKEAEANG